MYKYNFYCQSAKEGGVHCITVCTTCNKLQPFDFEKLDKDIKEMFPSKNQSQEQPYPVFDTGAEYDSYQKGRDDEKQSQEQPESEDEIWRDFFTKYRGTPNNELKEQFTIKRK